MRVKRNFKPAGLLALPGLSRGWCLFGHVFLSTVMWSTISSLKSQVQQIAQEASAQVQNLSRSLPTNNDRESYSADSGSPEDRHPSVVDGSDYSEGSTRTPQHRGSIESETVDSEAMDANTKEVTLLRSLLAERDHQLQALFDEIQSLKKDSLMPISDKDRSSPILESINLQLFELIREFVGYVGDEGDILSRFSLRVKEYEEFRVRLARVEPELKLQLEEVRASQLRESGKDDLIRSLQNAVLQAQREYSLYERAKSAELKTATEDLARMSEELERKSCLLASRDQELNSLMEKSIGLESENLLLKRSANMRQWSGPLVNCLLEVYDYAPRTEPSEAEKRHAKSEAEISRLVAEVRQLQASLQQREIQILELGSNIDELKLEHSQVVPAIDQQRQNLLLRLEEIELEKSRLLSEAARAIAQNQSLAEKLARSESISDNLAKRLEEMDAQSRVSEAELGRLREDLLRVTQESVRSTANWDSEMASGRDILRALQEKHDKLDNLFRMLALSDPTARTVEDFVNLLNSLRARDVAWREKCSSLEDELERHLSKSKISGIAPEKPVALEDSHGWVLPFAMTESEPGGSFRCLNSLFH